MTKKIGVILVVVILLPVLALFGCKSAAPKETAQEFYKGKTINLVVPFNPGGGVDVQCRLFAPYLAKYTGASVVVQNMPGAGGTKGDNYIYATAPKDGLTVSVSFGDQMVIRQFLSEPGVQYDVSKFSWIGRWFIDDESVAIGKKLPSDLAGLLALPRFKLGVVGGVGLMTWYAAAFANALSIDNAKIISGYDSTNDISLAVGQGELHGMATDLSANDVFCKEAGFMKQFAILSKVRNPKYPNVPTVFELAQQAGRPPITGDKEKWINMGDAMRRLSRSMLAPPDMPQDRVEFLRDAFMKAVADKEWQTQWANAKFPLDGAGRGDELQKAAAINLTQQEIKDLNTLLKEKYVN